MPNAAVDWNRRDAPVAKPGLDSVAVKTRLLQTRLDEPTPCQSIVNGQNCRDEGPTKTRLG
eukprot:9599840-Lingulodinium_polyedra.AAC.1